MPQKKKNIEIGYLPWEEISVDILTKPLSCEEHEKYLRNFGIEKGAKTSFERGC